MTTILVFVCTCFSILQAQSKAYPYRPSFHFVPLPLGWMNDPNGPFYDSTTDLYHLFFQYQSNSRNGAVWGHTISKDLLHWQNLPIALPQNEAYNKGGVWTGSITQVNGKIYAIYAVASQDFICMATPSNLSDPYLTQWTEYNNCILNATAGTLPVDKTGNSWSRDPSIAFTPNNGKSWNFIVAHDINNHKGGGGLNFYTTDWIHFQPNPNGSMIAWSNFTGWWDCVDIFELPKSQQIENPIKGNIKYIFKTSSYFSCGDIWIYGDYNISNGQFIPYNHQSMDDAFDCKDCICALDYGSVYASKTFYDSKNDRQILWGWIQEERDTANFTNLNNWAGVQTLPREIILLNETESPINEPLLVTNVISEFNELRIINSHFEKNNVNIVEGNNMFFDLNDIHGNALDIELIWKSGSRGDCGLYLLSDGEILNEYTRIGVNFNNVDNGGTIYVDTTMSSLNSEYQPFEGVTQIVIPGWNGIDSVKLRVIVDHSVINVFVNDGIAVITRRAYPQRTTNFYVGVYAYKNKKGDDCILETFNAWNITSVNPLP
eukprot:547241_1